MVLLLILIPAILFLLFAFKDQVKGGLNKLLEDKSPQQIEQEKIDADTRDAKGGIGNSWDWIFGEGNWQKLWQGSADAAQASEADKQAQQQGATLESGDINVRTSKANVFNPTTVKTNINPIEKEKGLFENIWGGLSFGGFNTLLIDPNQKTSFFGGQAKDKPVIKTILTQQTNPKGATPIFSKTELSRGQTRFGSNVGTSESSNIQDEAKTEEQIKFLTTPQSFRSR